MRILIVDDDPATRLCLTKAYFQGRADGFVKKPLRLDELKATLRTLGVPLV